MTTLSWHDTTIEVMTGDITTLAVDAIVNAANESLLGGGGVDGAIHRAAGPGLRAECQTLHGCPTGDAKITQGYDLPAAHVIHAVGPVWHGGKHGEEALLESAYRNSFARARENDVHSIAFPAISTGVYRFPKDRAAAIAAAAALAAAESGDFSRIILCCFSESDAAIYGEALTRAAER
ncbi:O-acetyl-ADP-ribose deacetylase [Consotaella salsifontis]|uniref:O-acetyl-ADP-ribose deacetylase (Regulator of RNase III), contains Macro domain n=1 Tax=Consotaella salsifontis TaxID=1365950 RepID=A0A1T4L2S3_9HYPH|nr:O-acetyl-ADP-ribose deacetylase [Consotaella salsifontis]SJZ49019.1 O-acetyl-ADP-ribose deacetylase (regulator of RNase III), contains Macro domain [Consotaella salsifontis]